MMRQNITLLLKKLLRRENDICSRIQLDRHGKVVGEIDVLDNFDKNGKLSPAE